MGRTFLTIMLASTSLLSVTPALAKKDKQADPILNLPAAPGKTDSQLKQQGPELDVFRDSAPKLDAPTIVMPPPPLQPAPVVKPETPARTVPQAAKPAPKSEVTPKAEPRVEARQQPLVPTERHAKTPATDAVEKSLPQQQEAPRGGAPVAAPMEPTKPTGQSSSGDEVTVQNDVSSSDELPVRASPEPSEGSLPWAWIAALVAILLGGFAFLRSRRKAASVVKQGSHKATLPAADVPASAPEEAMPEVSPVDSAPTPIPPTPSTERPWIEVSMTVRMARWSLMGVTVGYDLALHNHGTAAAEDILIRSRITNAGGSQQTEIQQFLNRDIGNAIHSVSTIAPGESAWLSGEIRLESADIVPVAMGSRSLLVPLVLMEADYRWIDEAGDLAGEGRSIRGFIVGEEQSPPSEKLAPFRFDLGPRQYRDPTCRETALSVKR